MAKACFCLSLPTFGYVIGILDLVLTVISFFKALTGGYSAMKMMNAEQKNVFIVIIAIACAISCALNGLFIYGINKKRAGFVLAFLFIPVLCVAIYSNGIVQKFVLGDVSQFFGKLIGCLVGIYIIYAIFMLYNEIKESSKASRYYAVL